MLTGFCPRCNCRFEVRNTTTMKIVVIIIICVLALLFIYMGFLLCLDPLMNAKLRQSPAYQPQRNDELNMVGGAASARLINYFNRGFFSLLNSNRIKVE